MAIGIDDGYGNVYTPPATSTPAEPPPSTTPAEPPAQPPQRTGPADEYEEPNTKPAPVNLYPPPPPPVYGLTPAGPADDWGAPEVTNTPNTAPARAGIDPNQWRAELDDPRNWQCQTGQPIDPSKPDSAYDGAIIGANGYAYGPGTPITDIPAARPEDGSNRGLAIFVNGVGNKVDTQQQYMQATANATGYQVVGIHNGTNGKPLDVGQAVLDKLGMDDNPARNTLANTIIQQIDAGQPVHIFAHSQGALITSGSLKQVENEYRKRGYSEDKIRELMGNIQVETFGGAGATWPQGPQYVHYVNTQDIVPTKAGGVPWNPATLLRDDTTVHTFSSPGNSWPLGPHGYTDVYLSQRAGKSWEEVSGQWDSGRVSELKGMGLTEDQIRVLAGTSPQVVKTSQNNGVRLDGANQASQAFGLSSDQLVQLISSTGSGGTQNVVLNYMAEQAKNGPMTTQQWLAALDSRAVNARNAEERAAYRQAYNYLYTHQPSSRRAA